MTEDLYQRAAVWSSRRVCNVTQKQSIGLEEIVI